MALRAFDGFNSYSATADAVKQWSTGTVISAISSSGRRAGTKACSLTAASHTLVKILDDQATFIFGGAFNCANPTVASTVISFRTSAGEQISVRRDSGQQLYVSRNGTTLWSSGTDAAYKMPVSGYIYIEFKATIDPTNGSWSLRINGSNSTLVTQATVNTAGQGGTTADRVQIHNVAGVTVLITDLYICDGTTTVQNDLLGDCRVDPVTITGNGTDDAFLKSTGTDAYALIDEATPNDDTDYIYSSTPGDRTTVNVSDMTFTPTYVHGVAITSYMRKDDSGARDAKNVLRINGTDYDAATTYALATAYETYRDIWALSPDTGVLFTQAEINAMEIGVKVEA